MYLLAVNSRKTRKKNEKKKIYKIEIILKRIKKEEFLI